MNWPMFFGVVAWIVVIWAVTYWSLRGRPDDTP